MLHCSGARSVLPHAGRDRDVVALSGAEGVLEVWFHVIPLVALDAQQWYRRVEILLQALVFGYQCVSHDQQPSIKTQGNRSHTYVGADCKYDETDN